MVVPMQVVQTEYLSLYQYGQLRGLSVNAIKLLIIQQRQIVQIYLQKPTFEGSTNQNIKLFNVLTVDLLFKKSAILYRYLDKYK